MLVASIHPFTLSFSKPFLTGRFTLTQRNIIFLALEDRKAGLRAFGEAAPLEVFATETYDEALASLQSIAPKLASFPVSLDAVTKLDELFPNLASFPTARFAVETALLGLCAQHEGIPLRHLLNPSVLDAEIPVNAIIGAGTIDEQIQDANTALSEGFTCIKLKVGTANLSDDVKRIHRLREVLGETMLIRLDANGVWNCQTALEALHAFEPFTIEYIEQPLPPDDVDGMRLLVSRAQIPIAADESVHSFDQALALLQHETADLLVMKPMALGSLLRCTDFYRQADALGKDVVFTSLLDSAIGRSSVAELIASLDPRSTRHHGLATGSLFQNDVASDSIRNGKYFFPSSPPHPPIKTQ